MLFRSETRQVLYVSPAYERIFGRSTDLLLADYRQWRDSVYPDAVDALKRWHQAGYQLFVYSSGSIQMTVQELSSILRRDLKPIIFLISANVQGHERGLDTLGGNRLEQRLIPFQPAEPGVSRHPSAASVERLAGDYRGPRLVFVNGIQRNAGIFCAV